MSALASVPYRRPHGFALLDRGCDAGGGLTVLPFWIEGATRGLTRGVTHRSHPSTLNYRILMGSEASVNSKRRLTIIWVRVLYKARIPPQFSDVGLFRSFLPPPPRSLPGEVAPGDTSSPTLIGPRGTTGPPAFALVCPRTSPYRTS